jgi:MoxR-like ATPase
MSQQAAAPEDFVRTWQALRAEVGKVIVGHGDIVDGVLGALFAGGHVLLEGAPGLGKTLLVKTLARALDLSFSRVQFTPDLMPADILGTRVLAEDADGRRHFEFQRGPVFANIVLADEVNRATPKTQSALLEGMQEHAVTTGGASHPLPDPFFVLATQNPIEMEGTYPLPEAQLDRFLFKLVVGLPGAEELNAILDRTTRTGKEAVAAILDAPGVLAMRALVREVPIASHVRDFATRLVMATHPQRPESPEITRKYLRYGASPRGAQALVLGAKVRALADGRYNVSEEDIRALAAPALRHRLILNYAGQAEGLEMDALIATITGHAAAGGTRLAEPVAAA